MPEKDTNMQNPQTITALLHDRNAMPSSPPTSALRSRSHEVLARFGDADRFKRLFDPIGQARLCRHVDRIFTGSAPSLVRIADAYGAAEAEALVMLYVKDLSEYTGVKDKITPGQMHETAAVIISEYGYLTIAEIMYFFYLFKAGRFGKFYGVVDGLVITNAIQDFLDVRNEELDRIERKKRKEAQAREEERMRKECLPYEEYTELKWLFNMGYEPKYITK